MKGTTKATLRYLRMSPRKARLLVDMIRGMRVSDAVTQLAFSKKTAAVSVRKLLLSAVANAVHNHGMEESSLIVESALVNGGPMQYRFTPRAFGRAAPIRKRTAHVMIQLEGEIAEKNAKKEKKEEAAERTEASETKKEEKKVAKPKKEKTKKEEKK